MESTESVPDPLDLDELIRQASAHKKAWRLPRHVEPKTRGELKEWQRLMEERLVKVHHWGSG